MTFKGGLALPNWFFSSLWPGLFAWSALFVSDYSLTIKCARLYRNGVSEKLVFEGSFELTPYFQRDIDSLRRISPRFLAMLLLGDVLLTAEWLLARESLPQMYAFLLGAMVLTQLTIHIRHLRNLFLFRSVVDSNALRGRVEYSRLLLLRMSAAELLTFSGLFFLLFVFTQNWFMLGGTMGCFFTALKHLRIARKLPTIPVNQELGQPAR